MGKASGHDPEGHRLSIKLDSTCNGEFLPVPLNPAATAADALARERVSLAARRTGQSRRSFLFSTCGAAATLAAMNDAFAAAGRLGGFAERGPRGCRNCGKQAPPSPIRASRPMGRRTVGNSSACSS